MNILCYGNQLIVATFTLDGKHKKETVEIQTVFGPKFLKDGFIAENCMSSVHFHTIACGTQVSQFFLVDS